MAPTPTRGDSASDTPTRLAAIPVDLGNRPESRLACPGAVSVIAWSWWAFVNQAPPRLSRAKPPVSWVPYSSRCRALNPSMVMRTTSEGEGGGLAGWLPAFVAAARQAAVNMVFSTRRMCPPEVGVATMAFRDWLNDYLSITPSGTQEAGVCAASHPAVCAARSF